MTLDKDGIAQKFEKIKAIKTVRAVKWLIAFIFTLFIFQYFLCVSELDSIYLCFISYVSRYLQINNNMNKVKALRN